MSPLKRFWDSIRLPPPVPRPEWAQEPPSAWKRFLHSLKPPPAVSATGELIPAEEVRRRRLIGIYSVTALVLLVAGWRVFLYLRSAPQRAEASVKEGMRLATSGDEKSAVNRMSRAIAIDPQSADAFLERGRLHQNMNQRDAAMIDIQKALALNPRLASAHVALGDLYRDRSDLQNALGEFSEALKLEQNVDAFYQRGQIYQALGDHRKAIEDFNAAVNILPDAPYIYRARATSEGALGDKEASRRDRRKAITIENHVSGLDTGEEP